MQGKGADELAPRRERPECRVARCYSGSLTHAARGARGGGRIASTHRVWNRDAASLGGHGGREPNRGPSACRLVPFPRCRGSPHRAVVGASALLARYEVPIASHLPLVSDPIHLPPSCLSSSVHAPLPALPSPALLSPPRQPSHP